MLIVPTNTKPGPGSWPDLLADAQTFAADLQRINRLVNKYIRYKRDVHDEWAGPRDVAKRGYGDCEDLALMKLALVPQERKWLCVGHYAKRPHAVAVVEDDGKWWVLDNLIDTIYELEGSQFKPAYGLGWDGERYLFLETRKASA